MDEFSWVHEEERIINNSECTNFKEFITYTIGFLIGMLIGVSIFKFSWIILYKLITNF